MKTETSPTQPLAPDAPPLLKIPKLKLKPMFDVYFYGSSKGATDKRIPIARGIRSAEDAVRIAWAMAEARSSMDGSIHIGAQFGKGHRRERTVAGSIPCKGEHRRLRSVSEELASVHGHFTTLARNIGLGAQRQEWLVQSGLEFSSLRFDLLRADDVFRVAFWNNNFSLAASRMAELERKVAA